MSKPETIGLSGSGSLRTSAFIGSSAKIGERARLGILPSDRIFKFRKECQNLSHHEYVGMLPSTDKLRTPLFFTASELEAFKGTNIYGATLDREREWRAEHASCLDAISKADTEWAASFTWSFCSFSRVQHARYTQLTVFHVV